MKAKEIIAETVRMFLESDDDESIIVDVCGRLLTDDLAGSLEAEIEEEQFEIEILEEFHGKPPDRLAALLERL